MLEKQEIFKKIKDMKKKIKECKKGSNELDLKICMCLWCLGLRIHNLKEIKTEEDIKNYIKERVILKEDTIQLHQNYINQNPKIDEIKNKKIQKEIYELYIEIEMLKEILDEKV